MKKLGIIAIALLAYGCCPQCPETTDATSSESDYIKQLNRKNSPTVAVTATYPATETPEQVACVYLKQEGKLMYQEQHAGWLKESGIVTVVDTNTWLYADADGRARAVAPQPFLYQQLQEKEDGPKEGAEVTFVDQTCTAETRSIALPCTAKPAGGSTVTVDSFEGGYTYMCEPWVREKTQCKLVYRKVGYRYDFKTADCKGLPLSFKMLDWVACPGDLTKADDGPPR